MSPSTPGPQRRYSRKEFFGALLLQAADSVQGALSGPVEAGRAILPGAPVFPWVRPPGALDESAFRDACTSCDDCIKACPHFVIRKAGAELGEGMSGTPVLVPEENPCLLCDGLPCITACDTGALVMPEEGQRPRMGVAVVDADACYMAAGQPCDYCQVNCPERPRAIDARVRGRVAVVDEDACTGCGVCAQICPPGVITVERLA